ncbi:MAG: hypothetical protein WCI36_05035 [bacterium]
MNKKIALSALAFAVVLPTSIAFAQEVKPVEAQREANKQAFEAQREANKKTMEATREANKQNFEVTREANKQAFETQREANKQNIETLRQEKKLEFQNKKEALTAEKCQAIEAKIANRVTRYQENNQMQKGVFANMQARLSRLLARLKAAGADTTQLEADIATLQTKIDKLTADQASFMATLGETQAFVCGKSEGEFKGKLEEARKVPELIKQDRQDIKNFFETTIKADLKAIRATLAAQKEVATPTTTPSSTESVQ